MEPHGPTFLAINYLPDSFEYGGSESQRGWRIVFDAMRQFFNPMRAIGAYIQEDAVFAIGETFIACSPFTTLSYPQALIIAVPHG